MKKNNEIKRANPYKLVISYLIIPASCLLVFIEATDFYPPAFIGLHSGGDTEKYFLMPEKTLVAVGSPFELRLQSPYTVYKLNVFFNLPLDY